MGRPINARELKELLTRAKNDPTFRDKLLSSPADTLKDEGLEPEANWVRIISDMTPRNFEEEMTREIKTLEGEGRT